MSDYYRPVWGEPTNKAISKRVISKCIKYFEQFGIPANEQNVKIEQKIGECVPDWTKGGRGRMFNKETYSGWYLFNVEYTSEQGHSIALCGVEYSQGLGVMINSEQVSFDSGGIIE